MGEFVPLALITCAYIGGFYGIKALLIRWQGKDFKVWFLRSQTAGVTAILLVAYFAVISAIFAVYNLGGCSGGLSSANCLHISDQLGAIAFHFWLTGILLVLPFGFIGILTILISEQMARRTR